MARNHSSPSTSVPAPENAGESSATNGPHFQVVGIGGFAQLAWTARDDGYLTWYNRRWYDYTGTSPEQMEGWGSWDSDNARVAADVIRLRQVVWNVLHNAIKFSPSGGTIRIRTFNSSATHCAVAIQDDGIGIPPEILPLVFKAFEQGDPKVAHQFGGLGLGLAISRSLMELQDGSIRAESAGTRCGPAFTIEFARDDSDPEQQSAQLPAHPTSHRHERLWHGGRCAPEQGSRICAPPDETDQHIADLLALLRDIPSAIQ